MTAIGFHVKVFWKFISLLVLDSTSFCSTINPENQDLWKLGDPLCFKECYIILLAFIAQIKIFFLIFSNKLIVKGVFKLFLIHVDMVDQVLINVYLFGLTAFRAY